MYPDPAMNRLVSKVSTAEAIRGAARLASSSLGGGDAVATVKPGREGTVVV